MRLPQLNVLRESRVRERGVRRRSRRALAATAVLATAAFVVTPAAGADGPPPNVPVVNSVQTQIPVGHSPRGVTVSADGSTVYVLNYDSQTILAIDAATQTVTGTATLFTQPTAMALSPDGTELWVSRKQDLVSIVSTATMRTIDSAGVSAPSDIIFAPDGSTVYAAYRDNIRKIDADSRDIGDFVAVGTTATKLLVSPDGATLYALGDDPDGVSSVLSVINTSAMSVVRVETFSYLALGWGLSPDGSTLWVQVPGSDFAFNTTSWFASQHLGTPSSCPALTTKDYLAYVVDGKSLNYPRAQGLCTAAVAPLSTVGTTSAIAVSPDGSRVYQVNSGANVLTVFAFAAAPAVPTALAASSGSGQVALTWAAPSDPGTSPITGYTVQYRATGDTAWQAQTATTASATVTGLTKGVGYDFRVLATNAVGDGPATAIVTSTPFGVPDAPAAPAVSSGESSLWVTWEAPADGGRPITGYTVNVYDGGTLVTSRPAAAHASGRTITGLANGTEYTVRVAATNAGGTGAESAATTAAPTAAPLVNHVATTIPANSDDEVVAASPDGRFLYVGGWLTRSVRVLAHDTGEVLATVTLPTYAVGLSVTSDGTQVYASTGLGLYVIDADTHAVTAPSQHPTIVGPAFFSPDGAKAYALVDRGPESRLMEIDTHTGASRDVLDLPGQPQNMAITDDGATIYVGYLAGRDGTGALQTTIAEVPVASWSVLRSVTVVGSGGTLAISRDGAHLYRAAPTGPVRAIDTADFTVDNIPRGTCPSSNDADTAYLHDGYGVLVANPLTACIVASADQGWNTSMAVSQDGATVYVIGGNSSSVRVLTYVVEAGAPTGLAGADGNGQVQLTWEAPADDGGGDITGYTVQYRATGEADWQSQAATTTSATVIDLTNGVGYDFRVFATNAAGNGPVSPVVTGTPYTVPDAPAAPVLTPGNTRIDVTWERPAFDGGRPVISYDLYYRAVGDTTWNHLPVDRATAAAIVDLDNGVAYEAYVTASNVAGPSAASDVATATPRTVPDAPTGLTAIGGDTSATLGWVAPVGDGGDPITDYLIEYREAGGAWQTFVDGTGGGAGMSLLRLAHGTGTTAKVTGLAAGTAYEFRVSAVNAAGVSAASTVATATTAAAPVAAPSDDDLSGTGFEGGPLTLVAALLLALGAVALHQGRRRVP